MKCRRSIIACGLVLLSVLCFSQKRLDSLKRVLSSIEDDSVRVNALSDIGGYLVKLRQYDEAFSYLSKAKELGERIGYKKGTSNALLRIGIIYMNKNDYASTTDYYLRALQLKKELGDKRGIADITSNIGIVYSDQGNYAKALEKYFTALKIREDIKDEPGTAISMMAIANIYFLQNKFNTALEYYFNLLKLKEAGTNKFFRASVMGNIGLTYQRLNDFPKALSYFNNSLVIDEQIGDKQGVGMALTNIGAIYSTQRNYEKALELLKKGCVIFEEVDDKKGVVETYYEMGNVYDSAGQYERSLECFEKQLQKALAINSKLNIQHAYFGLARHYEHVNNYKEAHRNYKLYKAIEDSLQNETGQKAIAEMETKYKTQKKEKEIELLKSEQDLKDATYARQKQLIYVSIALFIAIVITVFLLYSRLQLKKKNQLERKNFELERNALSAQMNPHFVFNSLGSISGFIVENEREKAVDYLNVFARLIRHNLEQSREQLITVTREAEMLTSYLQLQQMRYDNKFDYEVIVDDSVDTSVCIPPMFVQPFIENSILHGLIPKEGRGKVSVRFYLEDDKYLAGVVSDNGIGREESMKRKNAYDNTHRSLAMTITRERMEIMNSANKEKITIDMRDLLDERGAVSGTEVRLSFPLLTV